MINVLLPAMGKSDFFKESFFPKPLIEIKGKTMLETVVDNYKSLKSVRHIFVFSEEDCMRFHVDSSAHILSDDSQIIKLCNQTAGALCTCLMAIDYINNDMPLIIANFDQIIDINYQEVIDYFQKMDNDAGIITFSSIHPRWSYAKIDGKEVIEVAEKRPLSKDAIAGFYYYRKGSLFIEAAEKVLLKQNSLEGRYYISMSLNELILRGMKVGYYNIDKEKYHSFYSPDKIKEYEG